MKRDLIIGYTGQLRPYGYLEDRLVETPMIVNPRLFRPRELTDEQKARYGCDVMFASRSGQPTEERIDELHQEFNDAKHLNCPRSVLQSVHDHLWTEYRAERTFTSYQRLREELVQLPDFRDWLLSLSPDDQDYAMQRIFWRLNDVIYRQIVIHWLVDYAEERNQAAKPPETGVAQRTDHRSPSHDPHVTASSTTSTFDVQRSAFDVPPSLTSSTASSTAPCSLPPASPPFRLYLYGEGWDKHPRFAPYYKGVLQHGEELSIAYQAAKWCLHLNAMEGGHQRALEIVASGARPLLRRSRSAVSADPLLDVAFAGLAAVLAESTIYSTSSRLVRPLRVVIGDWLVKESVRMCIAGTELSRHMKQIEVAVTGQIRQGQALAEGAFSGSKKLVGFLGGGPGFNPAPETTGVMVPLGRSIAEVTMETLVRLTGSELATSPLLQALVSVVGWDVRTICHCVLWVAANDKEKLLKHKDMIACLPAAGILHATRCLADARAQGAATELLRSIRVTDLRTAINRLEYALLATQLGQDVDQERIVGSLYRESEFNDGFSRCAWEYRRQGDYRVARNWFRLERMRGRSTPIWRLNHALLLAECGTEKDWAELQLLLRLPLPGKDETQTKFRAIVAALLRRNWPQRTETICRLLGDLLLTGSEDAGDSAIAFAEFLATSGFWWIALDIRRSLPSTCEQDGRQSGRWHLAKMADAYNRWCLEKVVPPLPPAVPSSHRSHAYLLLFWSALHRGSYSQAESILDHMCGCQSLPANALHLLSAILRLAIGDRCRAKVECDAVSNQGLSCSMRLHLLQCWRDLGCHQAAEDCAAGLDAICSTSVGLDTERAVRFVAGVSYLKAPNGPLAWRIRQILKGAEWRRILTVPEAEKYED